MVCVNRDLCQYYVVCQVIRRLDNPVVDSHTALVDYARLSALHRMLVRGGFGGSGFIHYTDKPILVDDGRKR